jgi:hypothetical protein
MTETPKDKREAALEKIKELEAKRSSLNAEPPHKTAGGSKARKGERKHGGGGPGHRPQGG